MTRIKQCCNILGNPIAHYYSYKQPNAQTWNQLINLNGRPVSDVKQLGAKCIRLLNRQLASSQSVSYDLVVNHTFTFTDINHIQCHYNILGAYKDDVSIDSRKFKESDINTQKISINIKACTFDLRIIKTTLPTIGECSSKGGETHRNAPYANTNNCHIIHLQFK